MFFYKNSWWLDSNLCPLVLEVFTLATVPTSTGHCVVMINCSIGFTKRLNIISKINLLPSTLKHTFKEAQHQFEVYFSTKLTSVKWSIYNFTRRYIFWKEHSRLTFGCYVSIRMFSITPYLSVHFKETYLLRKIWSSRLRVHTHKCQTDRSYK